MFKISKKVTKKVLEMKNFTDDQKYFFEGIRFHEICEI